MLQLLAALWIATAAAGEPELTWRGDTLVVDVVVDAPLERVLPILTTPTEIARIDGGGTEITLLSQGPCDELNFKVPSFVGAIEYVVDFCRNAEGSVATLKRSEDMAQYRAAWSARPTEGGVHIHYEILALPAMRVPKRLVLGATKRQVRRLFEKMVTELEGGG